MVQCAWCKSHDAVENKTSVYWELPDGSRAIEISSTPSIKCHSCGIEYQKSEHVQKIEFQLYVIDTKQLKKSVTYEELMSLPRES